MGALIWIIVLIIILSIARNNRARKSKGKTDEADMQKTRPDKESPYMSQAKPNKPKPGTKTAKPNKPKPGTKTAKLNQPKPGVKTAKPDQQTADRVQRYGSYNQVRQQGQSPASALHQTRVDDILESARENNQAVQLDNDMDTIEIGDLMVKVQDNIVMGPADTLAFQRDFVAEGMDLLNRYMMIPGTEA